MEWGIPIILSIIMQLQLRNACPRSKQYAINYLISTCGVNKIIGITMLHKSVDESRYVV